MYPKIQPKQWKRGGGQQTTSVGVRPIRRPMKYPLLSIEWCVKQAAFGREVVPDVNWMLIMSSWWRGESGMIPLPVWELDSESKDVKGVVAERGEVSIREDELSTRKMFRSEGTASDSTFFPPRSGIICFKRDTFSLGGLYGRFVSVPMIKCAASRCRNAEMTCMELNAGFSGTYFLLAMFPIFSLISSSSGPSSSPPNTLKLDKHIPISPPI
jgi:hypothetical protein